MTSFHIVNFFGWFVFVLAWAVRWYFSRKEDKMSESLNKKISVAKTDEEILEVEAMFVDLHQKRFGLLGSYGISIIILTFGLGLYISNIIHLIFN